MPVKILDLVLFPVRGPLFIVSILCILKVQLQQLRQPGLESVNKYAGGHLLCKYGLEPTESLKGSLIEYIAENFMDQKASNFEGSSESLGFFSLDVTWLRHCRRVEHSILGISLQ